jgi:hypothetical protein
VCCPLACLACVLMCVSSRTKRKRAEAHQVKPGADDLDAAAATAKSDASTGAASAPVHTDASHAAPAPCLQAQPPTGPPPLSYCPPAYWPYPPPAPFTPWTAPGWPGLAPYPGTDVLARVSGAY